MKEKSIIRKMRIEDVQEAYFKAVKELRKNNPLVKQDDIFNYAVKMKAPRFYVTFENARRYISLLVRKGTIPIVNKNKQRMYEEIYRRYLVRVVNSRKTCPFEILKDIINEPAPSFYLDIETFRGIVYKAFRLPKKITNNSRGTNND